MIGYGNILIPCLAHFTHTTNQKFVFKFLLLFSKDQSNWWKVSISNRCSF